VQAWALWEQGRAMALLDEAVALIETGSDGMIIISELERCVKIGLLCVQDAPGDRPDMSAVVAMLTSKISHIDQPNKQACHNSTSADLFLFLKKGQLCCCPYFKIQL